PPRVRFRSLGRFTGEDPSCSTPAITNRVLVLGTLLIVQNRSRHLLAQFEFATGRARCGEMRTHFLQSGSELSNLFLQFLHFAMFVEKLIEQHRVHRIVTNRVRLAVVVASHWIWVYSLHL